MMFLGSSTLPLPANPLYVDVLVYESFPGNGKYSLKDAGGFIRLQI